MKLSKVLLIGSVGLVGVGIFMWYRSRKAATETASALAAATGPAPGAVQARLSQSALQAAVARMG